MIVHLATLAAATRFELGSLVCVGAVVVAVLIATAGRRGVRHCPKCRELNRPPAIFCAQCGMRLPGR